MQSLAIQLKLKTHINDVLIYLTNKFIITEEIPKRKTLKHTVILKLYFVKTVHTKESVYQ